MLTRRSLLASAAAAAMSPGLPQSARARHTPDTAALARRLGRPLRILVPEGAEANLAPVMRRFGDECGCASELVVSDLDNINAQLMLEAVLPGHEIDVALPATFGIPDLAEAGAILPLDGPGGAAEHAGGDEGGGDGGEDGHLYRTGDRFDGRIWGYQTDGDVYLMFYNTDMLHDEEAGARYADLHGQALEIPRTWAELDRQMAFFHDPDAGRYGGSLFRTATYAGWEFWARFHALGGLPFGADFAPAIAGEAGVRALEAMIASQASLTGTQLGLFDSWDRYARGDIYACIGWGGTQKVMHKPGSGMRDRVAHGPLPGGEIDGRIVEMSYFNWGWSYVVARHCPAPELAGLFCRFATSPDVSSSAVAAVEGYFDPFRAEHYEDPRILEAYGASFLREHRKAMTAPIPDLYIARHAEYSEALSYWLILALAGDVPPETALRNVETAWNLTTEAVGRAGQSARWEALLESYPEELRALRQEAALRE